MTATYNDSRIRKANGKKPNAQGRYVLYWMQAGRRLDRNHALDYAQVESQRMGRPLVVYEGLRLDYPWASDRMHRFMLEGMRSNAAHAERIGVSYWPFVETPDQPARGLLRKLAAEACLIVTDDYPAFIVPGQIRALAAKVEVPVVAVDNNSIVPLVNLGLAVSAAAHLRPRIHRQFAEAWEHRAVAEPVFTGRRLDAPFVPFDVTGDLPKFLTTLPIDHTVPGLENITGGSDMGRTQLKAFVRKKLGRYAEERNQPDDPKRNAASGMSPWLRHGHLSIQEVAETVLMESGEWTPANLNMAFRGKREGFFQDDPNVNSFLDEALTWRDVGYHWHFMRNVLAEPVPLTLATALPEWAKATLAKHASDRREHLYTLAEFESADTHDTLWNMAQTELVRTGKIHNYLRMLWGKKVLEWSVSPEEAYATLEHLNNKYAIDGRDPNSYTGILWTFGLFDRPWPPERQVFGNVRFMSSANTGKKYDLDDYTAYVRTLAPLGAAPAKPIAGQLFE